MADIHPHADVLIVGAGSAGCVLAEQLSADPACHVMVLESGPGPGDSGTDHLGSDLVSSLVADGLHLPVGPDSPVAGRYETVLTEAPLRQAQIVRGRTIGGSGAVNGGYFCRALPADFASPALPGWSWPEIDVHHRALHTDLDFPESSGKGPIGVARVTELCRLSEEFVRLAVEAGVPWLPNLNTDPTAGGEPSVVGAVPLNILDGIRLGPGAVFLRVAAGRPNLNVMTRTRATSVRFRRSRAVGVEVIGPSGPLSLTADRIVLSAGAIESAHLLMLSGIGLAEDLRRAGIAVNVNLPVGQSCWDHPEWVVPTTWSPSGQRPVLEVVMLHDSVEIRPYTRGFVGMTAGGGGCQSDPVHIGVALMRPESRGRISVISADPLVPPRIEHRYDRAASDVVALRNGARLVGEIVGAAADPGRASWSTSQHLCGSSPMGGESEALAVVDPQCRVLGVEGLWVVDGSVLARPISRGPHATIAMVGHRAAEFLRRSNHLSE